MLGLCRSIFIICDLSISVSVSRIESRNCEKRFVSRLTIACRDVCDVHAKKVSFVSYIKSSLLMMEKKSFVKSENGPCDFLYCMFVISSVKTFEKSNSISSVCIRRGG